MNTPWTHPARTPDPLTRQQAAFRQQILTKPAGSLGQLENVAITLAGLQGRALPQIRKPWVTIFAADHGCARAGTSAFPQEVTAQMIANFAQGGAAICVLARENQATLEVMDVGVISPTGIHADVIQAKVGPGTHDWTGQSAMTEGQWQKALSAGRTAVERALSGGADLFIGGEMGIGNTTSATALACAWLGKTAEELAGPGTGLDSAGMQRKIRYIDVALQHHRENPADWMCKVGGFEIAALCGAYIAAAQAGLPVLVDGFISTVAALAACRMNPSVREWLLFGHRSAEPAHALVLESLRASPLLQLDMRLGEGSGAAAALPLLKLACALHAQMATFAEAGVSEKSSGTDE